jgi:hypothetical protein
MTRREVFEGIHNAFPIFNYGMKHLYEVVDRSLNPVLWNPEGIEQVRSQFLYGEHGLRSNILSYLTQEFPSIGRATQEAVCDEVTSDIEERFYSALKSAECARQVTERYAAQN